ncbi:MAG: hypothetical protein ASARMPRED_007930 [Alectoria sarmentosa]|nr:MAG: hypothetical protein ASARMPRED_007930 [Alectoria sarmentosa]
MDIDLTAQDILQALQSGNLTSEELVLGYLAQINKTNHYLRAVLQVSPTLVHDAKERDRERQEGSVRGPLHGLPILVKASFATEPYFGMDTISGNYSLSGSRPRKNAEAVQRLLDAGAILLGKGSLSELAYWKIGNIPAGWSPVGGQGQSSYVKGGRQPGDPIFSINGPGGSSSGPSIAVAAGYAPIALGEETSGSLIFPADRAALYTLKVTHTIIGQRGMVPVSLRFDTAGPLAKSSRDVALFLDILVDASKTQVPPEGYISCAKGASAWKKLRVGVLDPESWLYTDAMVGYANGTKQQIIREISAAYEKVGTQAKMLSPVTIESTPNATALGAAINPLMLKLYEHDYRRDFDAYLEGVDNSKIKSLKDILTPDDKYGALRTPDGQFGLEELERAIFDPTDDEEALAADAMMREAGRANGIDKALQENDVDVLLGPGSGTLYSLSAAAGYPIATLPLSYMDINGAPFGLVALASAHQESLLVSVQSAWEATFLARKVPSTIAVS